MNRPPLSQLRLLRLNPECRSKSNPLTRRWRWRFDQWVLLRGTMKKVGLKSRWRFVAQLTSPQQQQMVQAAERARRRLFLIKPKPSLPEDGSGRKNKPKKTQN